MEITNISFITHFEYLFFVFHSKQKILSLGLDPE